MARVINRLSALKLARITEPGFHHDGLGLHLQIKGRSRSWVYRYMLHGRAREMGLGPVHTISLAEARELAAQARRLRQQGIDPIEHRNGQRQSARLAAAASITFKGAAEQYIVAHAQGWRDPKNAVEWRAVFRTYAFPVLGERAVQEIDLALVMRVLEPIWGEKPTTAARLRRRIEAVLDWAKVRGYREGDNPAAWRGHLDKLLPARSKVAPVVHHPALPYVEVPAFVDELRRQDDAIASALEFLILTSTRSGEVRGAVWSEVDFAAKVWTIPGARMKKGREHRVPLSPRALEILDEIRSQQHRPAPDAFVFQGRKPGTQLPKMVFLTLLARMRPEITPHGFRSSFRDWVAERTAFPREIAEAALAHLVGDATERAYQRGDFFQKRARLMQEWAKFCSTPAPAVAEVTSINAVR